MEYNSVEHRRALDGNFKVAVIVSFLLCLIIGVLALIMSFIRPPEIIPGSERYNAVIPIVVITIAVVVIILRRFWLSGLIMRMVVRSGVPATLRRLLQMTVVCGSISMLVAMAGLWFFVKTGNYRYSLILCLVSLLLILYTGFPRRGEWDRAVSAAANMRA